MLGKFGKITTWSLAALALLALAWLFAISKAQLELSTLALTLLAAVVLPLLTVFMVVKKQKGFKLASILGVVYLLLGAATVFRTLNLTDSFSQTTMYTGVASAVLGALLVFASGKASKEETEEEATA